MIWPASALLRKIAQDLRASYWFTPAFMVVMALLAAVGTESLDRYGVTGWIPKLYYGTTADAARPVLTVIATASIGAAGVMFSMTMVAVSFASANFGPRLIRNFMQDRGVQISLGALLSTFVYALIVLRSIQSGEDPLPALSLTCALGLALISVGVMIYFVHHIPELISLENITAALGRRLLTAIETLPRAEMPPGEPNDDDAPVTPVLLPSAGYLQAVNCRSLSKLSKRHDLSLHILKWPGDFVAPHSPVAELRGNCSDPSDRLKEIADCFAVGTSRTEDQNPLFIVRQLTEIIARALSPGINDPFTAITCLHWLHAALYALAEKGPVNPLEATGLGPAVPLGFIEVLEVAHAVPRSYIAADTATTVQAHLLLSDLARTVPPGPRRDAVDAELQALLREARALQPDNARIAELSLPDLP